jgi:hypothetical protein
MSWAYELLYLRPWILERDNLVLCSYHNQTKMSFLFSFTKSENRRVEHVLTGVEGLVPLGAGRRWGKGMGG